MLSRSRPDPHCSRPRRSLQRIDDRQMRHCLTNLENRCSERLYGERMRRSSYEGPPYNPPRHSLQAGSGQAERSQSWSSALIIGWRPAIVENHHGTVARLTC